MVDDKPFDWNKEKNEWLRAVRGLSFEAVLTAIENDQVLADVPHPHPSRANQRILVVAIDGYACVVPYVEDDETIFLKTIYKSREYQRQYMDTVK